MEYKIQTFMSVITDLEQAFVKVVVWFFKLIFFFSFPVF